MHDRSHATDKEILRASNLFKALAHPDRLKLICMLGDGRVTTQTALIKELGWPQPTVCRHVAALRRLGLVSARREGNEVFLRMGTSMTEALMATVCEWIHSQPPRGAGVSGSVSRVARSAMPDTADADLEPNANGSSPALPGMEEMAS